MRILIVASLLIAATVASAQSHAPKNQSKDELRFTLILSRHGVRPPIVATSELNLQSSAPWPAWEVPAGFLTPHGGAAIQQMGAYMRMDLARKGLLPAHGCPGSNEIYFYSDIDERNILSSRSTIAGLEPGCDALPVHMMIAGSHVKDPLFLPVPEVFPMPSAAAIAADQQAATGNNPAAFFSLAGNPALKELADVLAPDPAHPAAKPILDDPRPLATGSTLVEDLLLEYTNGKPMPEVGWGRVDRSALRRLIPLHVKAFNFLVSTPLATRIRGSNLMAHILDTLEQAAQSAQTQNAQAVQGALGPVGARLVYISGHDGNLVNVSSLLNLHWDADGVADDTPPDSQIVFELWQNRNSKQYSVRMLYRAQTLDQLRSGQALTLADPPDEVSLTPPGCSSGAPCPFADFDKAARAVLDPAYVQRGQLPTQIAPQNP
jgi:4-phytase/acid phosphatase